MTTDQRANERIAKEVISWPGVVAGTGRRGEPAFEVGRREPAYLHGDRVALLRVDDNRLVARHGLPSEVAP